ncbi:hypothetical protein [Legionella maceachernii]|uniref:hypothetical protein n=1 Tax=Legionella maceachernii TaxID=466 RepID=UPI00080265F9|nr:hypothetical protein [Legionella maceachernii]
MTKRKMVWVVTKKSVSVFWRLVIVVLEVVIAFASDERPKARFVAIKARRLRESGSITGAECAKHIRGDT